MQTLEALEEIKVEAPQEIVQDQENDLQKEWKKFFEGFSQRDKWPAILEDDAEKHFR